MRCDGCGLVFSDPIMDDKGVSILYEGSSETNVTPGEEANVKRTMAGYYRMAAPYVPSRERILDVGCDIGLLLQAAKEDGFRELYGIEPVPEARRQSAGIPGAHISDIFFETSDYPEGYFDFISFVHVVDHLYNPRIALKKAFNNLKPGGVVLAVVHNVRSWLYFLLRERFPIFNLYHHFFFDKKTLAALFAAEGYEVIAVNPTRNCYSLGFFASRIPGAPASVRRLAAGAFDTLGIGGIPINIPVGNIAIVARRPALPTRS